MSSAPERVSREDLEQIPAGTALLRQLRHYTPEQLADLTDDDLDLAHRWLLAAAYSAAEGARAIQRTIDHRTKAQPCSISDPNTTPATTATPPPPPASEASAPRSPSTNPTTTPAS